VQLSGEQMSGGGIVLDFLKSALYDDLVGVITSGQVTKMVVTLFDVPYPKTSCYTQPSRLCFQ